MMKLSSLFLSVTLVIPAFAQAELFRWVNAEGAVTYQDQPPPEEVTTSSMVKLPALFRGSRSKNSPVVTLYRSLDCAPCDSAADYLKRHSLQVREVDISRDLDNQKELKEKIGSLSVPTIVVNNKVIKGFTPSWLASELEAAGYVNPPISDQEEIEDSSETDRSEYLQGRRTTDSDR